MKNVIVNTFISVWKKFTSVIVFELWSQLQHMLFGVDISYKRIIRRYNIFRKMFW